MNRSSLVAIILALAAPACSASMPSAAASPSEPGGARAESVESVSDAPAPQAAPASVMSMSARSATPSAPSPRAPVAAKSAGGVTSAPAVAKKGGDEGGKKDDAQNPAFLIMYTGDVSMVVDDGKASATIDKIVDVAESEGGHLSGRKDQSVQVRIPSAHFREALSKVSELGDVVHQSVTAEDVSEEYHDAEVRLSNLKATRQRLQDFLAKAPNVNDMLTLERELERVSMDIDRIEGRMRYLREHAAFSTLTVALSSRPKAQPLVGTGSPPPPAPKRVMQLHASWLDDMGVPKLEAPGT
jgi:hypothetical protein